MNAFSYQGSCERHLYCQVLCVSMSVVLCVNTIGGTCISMCLGNGEEGKRELHRRGVEKRCEDSICSGCQQHPGGGGPGGINDHIPHGKS